MKRSKTSGRHKEATGILRKAAEAIGSAMGMLAATTGISDGNGLPKMKAKATTTQKALPPPVKKHTKKAPAKRTPVKKRARALKP